MTRRAPPGRLLRIAALGAAILALLATSVPHEIQECPAGSVLEPGTASFTADTTCGAPGPLAVAVSAACLATVDGAAAAGLPAGGYVDRGQLVLEDASRSCYAEASAAPGVLEITCYHEESGGCTASNLPVCNGTLTRTAP